MSVRTTSLVPFKINNIPDRYTMVYVADPTVVTATSSGASATLRLNRLQSGSFTMATQVVDVVEMGSKYRPGGVDNLGEASWNLSWNSVGIGNIAALTGTAVPTTANTSLTISSDNLNNSTVDFIRLVADNAGNVFGTLYLQDCITESYGVDASETGVITENASGKGPNSLFFPGFVVPKTYVASSGDVSAGYITISGIFSDSEAPVEIYQPSNGEPPSYWQQNGSVYFLKIERVPGADLSNTPIRYFENLYNSTNTAVSAGSAKWVTPAAFSEQMCIVGNQVTFPGSSAETVTITAVASQVNTTQTVVSTAGSASPTVSGGTGILGIIKGVTLTVDSGTNQENVVVTATTSTTYTATFTKTHAAGVAVVTNSPSFQATYASAHSVGDPCYSVLSDTENYNGQATYNPSTSKMYFGDTFASGDLFRLVFCSYNTDTSLPLSIPNNADTTDRAAVPSRMVPLKINALNGDRISKASYKMSLKRDHVQGIGENKIAYGISSVPDVSIDVDAKETDLSLLALLQTGSKNLTSQGGTAQADFEDLNYITRSTLTNAVPTSINLYDPFNAAKIICTWSSPQFIPTSIGYSSSNKSDNTVKISGQDITGDLTITYVVPQ